MFDAAADTVRFPRRLTLGLGPWSPAKFYRAARFNPAEATLSFNVGELSPFRGMTYAEIASESRSQHLSQGFGSLQRHGTSLDYVLQHVNAPALSDPKTRAVIADAVQGLGLSSQVMPSGAGHDAQDLARICPMGMIFVPSVKGISHSPLELTRAQDVTNGANVLLQTILRLDQG